MSQQLQIIDYKKSSKDRLYHGKTEDVFYYKIKEACYLYAEANKQSCALIIQDSISEIEAQMPKYISSVEEHLKTKADFYKIIGPTPTATKIERYLKDKAQKVANTVFRNQEYELYHYFESGKLRLSREVILGESSSRQEVKKVLIVDDSATIRNLLSSILQTDPGLQVVATAESPMEVEDLIKKHQPHVITLDIHMPQKDGVTLLKELFPKYKIPTIMISSISKDEGPMVFDALENGAIDYIQKPSLKDLDQVAPYIIERVKAAAEANVKRHRRSKVKSSSPPKVYSSLKDSPYLVAIGSSTGGTEALREILQTLPAEIPPIVIVQHIPPVFSNAFAMRLNELCPFEVKEAVDGDEVRAGRVLIAPGGKQMRVVRETRSSWKVTITDEAPVNRHKPSVDVLFNSIADQDFKNVIGVILTGMGADGAKGLLALKNKKAHTIAQDQESCVVFGMPKEAIRIGAAIEVLSLENIAGGILDQLSQTQVKAS